MYVHKKEQAQHHSEDKSLYTEAINVTEAIAETIRNAAQDTETFSLPLAFCQTSGVKSEVINAAYETEIERYLSAPVAACDKANAVKLLKRFTRKSFHDFWTSPVSEYLPALSEGTMKLCETVYPHDEAIRHAKELIGTLSADELAKDFLYGVAHNAPEYRTALACYYYIKNLPEHTFIKRWVGQSPDKTGVMIDRYNENCCEICGYQHKVSAEPKMRFWHINMDMSAFYLSAGMSDHSLNQAIIFLEEYKKLPHPPHDADDFSYFQRVLAVIEEAPVNTTSGKLKKILKQSGLLTMTLDQISNFIDMLGYLDILHSEDARGMVFRHTCQKDMLPPLSENTYAAYPVYRWTRKCGIDGERVSTLFGSLYDDAVKK